MEQGTPRLLPPSETAPLLGVTPQTLAIWRVTGKGPRYVKVGSRVMYDQADITAYIEDRKRSSTAEYAPVGAA